MFATRLQRLGERACVDIGVLQRARQQTFGSLQQSEQQVFDENFAAATHHTALGCSFEIALGLGVECLNQLLKVYVNHFIVLNESGCPG